MSITAIRAVIDTNIFIASIGKKSPFRWIFDAIIEGELMFCVSNSILLEYREILELKTNEEVAENILNFLTVHPYVEKYETYFDLGLIHDDPDDNKFCDCAFASGAILVNNDAHFKVLYELGFPKISFMTLVEFTGFLQQ